MGKKVLVDLDDPLQASLEAFCEAHYGAPQAAVVREALKAFIDDRLAAEPEVRKRYEKALARKLGKMGDKVRVLEVRHKRK